MDDTMYIDGIPEEIHEGYPLSSILVNKKLNKYDVYLTEEDKNWVKLMIVVLYVRI